MDDNEIIARNNGAASPLHLQAEGGDLVVHGTDNESSRFIVTDQGRVGIGLASPAEKLHITGNLRVSGRITSGTNVGIGTTTPKTPLQVFGTNDASLTNSSSGLLMTGDETGLNLAMDGNEIMARNNGAKSTLNLQAEGGDLLVHGTGTLSSQVVVTDEGNVGIGLASPSAKLDVAGSINYSGTLNVGLQYVSTEFTMSGNSRAFRTKPCPAGTRVLGGGGGHTLFNSAADDIKLNFSGPEGNNAWKILLTNTSGDSRGCIIWAICAKVQ
jgi:hypothetical protein